MQIDFSSQQTGGQQETEGKREKEAQLYYVRNDQFLFIQRAACFRASGSIGIHIIQWMSYFRGKQLVFGTNSPLCSAISQAISVGPTLRLFKSVAAAAEFNDYAQGYNVRIGCQRRAD